MRIILMRITTSNPFQEQKRILVSDVDVAAGNEHTQVF